MFLQLQFQRPEHTVLQILIAVSTSGSCQDSRSVQQCLTNACLHRAPPCWVLLGTFCLVPYLDRSEWPYVALASSPLRCCVTMVTSSSDVWIFAKIAIRLEMLTYLIIQTVKIRSVISHKNNATVISGMIKAMSVFFLSIVFYCFIQELPSLVNVILRS